MSLHAPAISDKEAQAPAARTLAEAAPGALRIGYADDPFEHEADRAADEVMSGGATGRDWSFSKIGVAAGLQRKCSCGGSAGAEGECEECKKKEGSLQRKAAGAATPAQAPEIVHEVLSSPGQPLDHDTRTAMEHRFGHDFGRVRIHTDAKAVESARAVDALAYTVGPHIAFAAGRYSPHTRDGSRLIAHELAHNIQQGEASVREPRMTPDDTAEQEAQQAANTVRAAKQVVSRPGQTGRLARQGSGMAREVPGPKVEEPEDEFKDIGHSKEYGKLSSWGWGAPETNNVYQKCDVAPLEREAFKRFFKSLPPEARIAHKKPHEAEEVLGVTSYNPEDAVPPKISTVAVQDEGKTVYKLKPTHAEMPHIRSAYTQAGEYVEGFVHDTTEECRHNDISKKLFWIMTPDTPAATPDTPAVPGGASKTREAEQEHCNDIRAAFDLTLGLYASAINNLAASERTYSKPEQAIKEGTRAAGVEPDQMIYKFAEVAAKTRLRDASDWHTCLPIGDPIHKDRPKKIGCKHFYTIDGTSWPQVGTHDSSEVMGMTKAAKPRKPTPP